VVFGGKGTRSISNNLYSVTFSIYVLHPRDAVNNKKKAASLPRHWQPISNMIEEDV
jgi:hypothetical protein